MTSFYVAQFVTGLANAASLFLVASGLSIIFGVTRVVNFAHGSFYMLGAYLAYSLVTLLPISGISFWVGIVLAALIVGVVGVLIEMTVLRRIYQSPELFQLVATFGVVLVIQDATVMIWGAEDKVGPRAPGLDGAVPFGDVLVPQYDFALIVLGFAVLAGLWLLFHRTRWGVLVRAATLDREMLGALGANQTLLFTGVFFVGAFLAGLGGAIQLPRTPVTHHMDLGIIADAFVVVVVGGMGSIPGAFLAAVIIAELSAFGILVIPQVTLVLMFLVMAVVLVLRPWGLLGKPELAATGGAYFEDAGLRTPGNWSRLGILALLVALLLLPLGAGDFLKVLMTEIFIMALFAASLHFIMGNGGLISFGHAAYFGLGAYGAALSVTYLHVPMEVAMLCAPIVAGAGALLFGWFCVRLSGVYMAMLSLAFAQIVWSSVIQSYEVTGGEDGLVGIWPSDWASSATSFYYLALAVSGLGIWMLRRMLFAPFGYTLRAGRDSPLRIESIGVDLRRQRWLAFAIAGTFAGIAGGLYAFSKGSVFPNELAIPRSVDALVMVLLGGVHTLLGPLVGAATFVGLEDQVSRLNWWRAILGLIILAVCVLAPKGIVGSLRDLTDRYRNTRIADVRTPDESPGR